MDALTREVPNVQLLPSVKFALQLEVTMADHPGHPCPLAFPWNMGMVMHILKSDPMLSDLKHVQVDGPGMAYLFFFDKQGKCWLTHKATQAMQAHMEKVFVLLCSLLCCQPPSPCVGVVPCSSGLRETLAQVTGQRPWTSNPYPHLM